MRKLYLACLFVSCLSLTASDKLVATVGSFVERCISADDQEKWKKNWEARLAQAAKDSESFSEDSYTTAVLCDLTADKRHLFHDPNLIPPSVLNNLCMLVVRLGRIPDRIQKELDAESLQNIIQFLNEKKGQL